MIGLFDKINFDVKLILSPIIYIVLGIVIYELLKLIITKIFKKTNLISRHKQKQAETLKIVLINLLKYLDIIAVGLAILTIYGINVRSILAGLGVTAVLIGLAFQDIAKDILAGISIILEDQYEIGDYVKIDGFEGKVNFIGLRTTRIVDYKGATKIIANHLVTDVINYSLNNTLAIVDIGIDYGEDCEKVKKVLDEMATNLKNKIKNAKGEIKVLGIETLADSAVVYRVTVETTSMEHYQVQRELRREIKKALDKENIKIPFPQVEVHNGK